MRLLKTCSIALLVLAALAGVPALAAKAPKPAANAQLLAQLKKAVLERDELKVRLAATENLQGELGEAQKTRDLARQETDRVRKELEQLKGALTENQGSADSLLEELRKLKADLAQAQADLAAQKDAARKDKLEAPANEGALVIITPEITPARPLNLTRITPKAKRVAGAVVVNVLISENGDVLASRLLQGLPGDGQWVEKGNAACVEAAKHIVFDPARAADGKTKVRVWQGVGFALE